MLEKKAEDLQVLDVRNICNFTDYFIICSGQTDRQVKAIYEHALRFSKKQHIRVHHAEADPSSRWMLIDLFDVILHIFGEDARTFYGLERVWRDAKKVRPPR